jgi:hypothetical protein
MLSRCSTSTVRRRPRAAERFGVSICTIKSRVSRAQPTIRIHFIARDLRQEYLGLSARGGR